MSSRTRIEIFRIVGNGRARQWHEVANCSEGFVDRLEAYCRKSPADVYVERRWIYK